MITLRADYRSGPYLQLLFLFFPAQHGIWNLHSPNRDQTCIPCTGSADRVLITAPPGSPHMVF